MQTASATLMNVLAAGAGTLPRPVSRAIGRRLGDLGCLLAPARRRLAAANMEWALAATVDAATRRVLLRKVFRHFGATLVETLLLPRMVRRGLLRHVEHQGWEHLEAALRLGRGAIIFTGHFGNWEMVALAQGARGVPMDVVGRPLDNDQLGLRLEATRRLTGNRTISKRSAVRPVLRSLAQGRTVGLVIDQNVQDAGALFVDFFGRPAATTPALAVFALKTGAPVLPVFGYPGPGGHRIVYGPPLPLPATGSRQGDILELTATATRIIEGAVRERPDLWLWMHDRWRSRPPGEAAAGGSSATPAGSREGPSPC